MSTSVRHDTAAGLHSDGSVRERKESILRRLSMALGSINEVTCRLLLSYQFCSIDQNCPAYSPPTLASGVHVVSTAATPTTSTTTTTTSTATTVTTLMPENSVHIQKLMPKQRTKLNPSPAEEIRSNPTPAVMQDMNSSRPQIKSPNRKSQPHAHNPNSSRDCTNAISTSSRSSRRSTTTTPKCTPKNSKITPTSLVTVGVDSKWSQTSSQWTCDLCTFLNQGGRVCELCEKGLRVSNDKSSGSSSSRRRRRVIGRNSDRLNCEIISGDENASVVAIDGSSESNYSVTSGMTSGPSHCPRASCASMELSTNGDEYGHRGEDVVDDDVVDDDDDDDDDDDFVEYIPRCVTPAVPTTKSSEVKKKVIKSLLSSSRPLTSKTIKRNGLRESESESESQSKSKSNYFSERNDGKGRAGKNGGSIRLTQSVDYSGGPADSCSWTCPRCTLLNAFCNKQCDACGCLRSLVAKVPVKTKSQTLEKALRGGSSSEMNAPSLSGHLGGTIAVSSACTTCTTGSTLSHGESTCTSTSVVPGVSDVDCTASSNIEKNQDQTCRKRNEEVEHDSESEGSRDSISDSHYHISSVSVRVRVNMSFSRENLRGEKNIGVPSSAFDAIEAKSETEEKVKAEKDTEKDTEAIQENAKDKNEDTERKNQIVEQVSKVSKWPTALIMSARLPNHNGSIATYESDIDVISSMQIALRLVQRPQVQYYFSSSQSSSSSPSSFSS